MHIYSNSIELHGFFSGKKNWFSHSSTKCFLWNLIPTNQCKIYLFIYSLPLRREKFFHRWTPEPVCSHMWTNMAPSMLMLMQHQKLIFFLIWCTYIYPSYYQQNMKQLTASILKYTHTKGYKEHFFLNLTIQDNKQIFTLLYCTSYNTGTLPFTWKPTHVTPLSKIGVNFSQYLREAFRLY